MDPAPPQRQPSADYLAPFESFQAYRLRRGRVYRGRVSAEFAGDRARLEQLLAAAPGPYALEEVDGRLFATIHVRDGPRPRQRLWLHISLLVLTTITVLGAGAEFSATGPADVAVNPLDFVLQSLTLAFSGHAGEVADHLWPDLLAGMARGVPYAAALLFVLLSHEMGHYLAARRYGIDATLPYLIPVPVMFGTLGAIIKMRSPITHRRALFDVGVAGPVAGLVASVAVCLIGLSLSKYEPRLARPVGVIEFGECLLFRGLARVAMGPRPAMHDVLLDPVALAGWFGLFVTFLNLMPLGQLDGGHLWYALIGEKQRYVGWAAFALLVALGFAFLGWLVLAALVLLLLRVKHPPVMDLSVSLGWRRRALGVLLVVMFVLLFIPEPVRIGYPG